MNHASGAVTALDPELIEVGDAIGQRAQLRGLLQGAVRPVRVVEGLVVAQDDHQMPLVPYQGPVQQLAPAAADPVGLEYTIVAVTCSLLVAVWVCQAAIWYSWVTPPRTCFRRIRCSARLISGGRVGV